MSTIVQTIPPLRILAQPKTSYRGRYMCETDRRRNRAQRFVRADYNLQGFAYPTVEVKFYKNTKLI